MHYPCGDAALLVVWVRSFSVPVKTEVKGMALEHQVEQPSAVSFFCFSYRFTGDRGLNVLCFHVYVYIRGGFLVRGFR